MTAEVEKVEVESSSKFDAEEKSGLDMNANQDLPNGTNHRADAKGNGKDDADGSYVFVSQNDAISDDPVECDRVPAASEEVEQDGGETGVVADEKIQTGASDDPHVEEVAGGTETVSGGEFTTEITDKSETFVSPAKEPELPQAGDKIEEVNSLISKEKAETRPDSSVGMRYSADPEMTEHSNGDGDVQRQTRSDLDANAGEKKSQVLVPEHVLPIGDDSKSDHGSESAKSAPDSDLNSQNDSRPIHRDRVPYVPNEDRTDQLGVAVTVPSSKENGYLPSNIEAVTVTDDSGGFVVGSTDRESQLEAVEVSNSAENSGVKVESGSAQTSPSVENGDSKLDADLAESPNGKAESVEVSSSFGGRDAGSESGTAMTPASAENGATTSEGETVKVHACVENDDAGIERETSEVPAAVDRGGAESHSKAAGRSSSGQDADTPSASQAANTSASKENNDVSTTDPVKDDVLEIVSVDSVVDATDPLPEKKWSSEQNESSTPPVQCDENLTQGSFKDPELEKAQTKKDEIDLQSAAEHSSGKGESSPTDRDQESDRTRNVDNSADTLQDKNEDSKSLPPSSVSEGAQIESVGVHPVPANGAVAGSEPKASDYGENSTLTESDAVGSCAEAGQSDVRSSKSHSADNTKVDVEGKDAPMNETTGSLPEKDACETIQRGYDVSTEGEPTESYVTSSPIADSADDPATECQAVESHVGSIQIVDSASNKSHEVKVELKDAKEETDNKSSQTAACASSAVETSVDGTELEEKGSTVSDDTVRKEVEDEVSEKSIDRQAPDTSVEIDAVQDEVTLPICPRNDTKPQYEAESVLPSENTVGKFDTETACVAPDSVSVINSAISTADGDVERVETVATSREGSIVEASEGNRPVREVERKPLLVRVPRYDDENLREQIRDAQLQVDKKTKSRDAIQAAIHNSRASCKIYRDKFEAALADERAARDLLRSKRQEIDSHQFMIDRVKSARSVEDIEARIQNMEHMIEHETLPLKEEKQLIREIKQLKQLREQISSNMGRQEEVQQALDEKDQTEERLKVLRKEADSLRSNILKAEAITKVAKKQYHDESDKLNQLQDQFRSADAIRQEAYAQLQDLRKQLREKNKHFYKYKDDSSAANDLALKRDRESVLQLCSEQVERFLDLWNNNEEFRKDYIRCNIRSTIRRFGTLDGRSLGPDEEPLTIPRATGERVNKDITLTETGEKHDSTSTALTQSKEVSPIEGEGKIVTKTVEQRSSSAAPKKAGKSAYTAAGGLPTISGRVESEETLEEEVHKLSKEEEEAARQAEEMRKKEDEARLKEQRRLEEIAKAKEAMERKKRIAEKNRMKAEIRAKKEAEEKLKEKEKKLRKKEKKKGINNAATVREDGNDGNQEQSSVPSAEACAETAAKGSEPQEKAATQPKRPQKPPHFSRQSKSKPIPPPLRNRGKRRMQQWMWVALVALAVVVLFLLGNSSYLSTLRV